MERVEPATALQLRFGAGDQGFAVMGGAIGGVGGLGGVGIGVGLLGPAPTIGLGFEHRFAKQWTYTLGVGGDFSGVSGATSFGLSVAPGVRWYPGAVLLSGAWASASLPVSWSESSTAGARAITTSGALELMLGWTFRHSSGFLASLGAGPALRVTRSRAQLDGTDAVATSAGLGLHAMVSAGLAF